MGSEVGGDGLWAMTYLFGVLGALITIGEGSEELLVRVSWMTQKTPPSNYRPLYPLYYATQLYLSPTAVLVYHLKWVFCWQTSLIQAPYTL